MNDINDDFILNLFIDEHGHIRKNFSRECWINKHSDIKEYIFNRYADCTDMSDIQEILYRMKNKLETPPTCIICGKPVKFKCFSRGYATYCSQSCIMADQKIQEKTKQTLLQHFGVEHPAQSKKIQEKMQQTCLQRYGKKSYTQTDEYIEKTKSTNLKTYNCEWSGQSPIVQEKSRETCKIKYNVEYSFQSDNNKEKSQKTWMAKYGVDNPMKSPEIKQKVMNTCIQRFSVDNVMKLPEFIEKGKQTCYEKYGDRNYRNFEKMSSHGSSDIEKQLITYFESNKISYKYQYKSELYPFHCDFYFPDIDLYLEIQGTWTHGKHPFDPTNTDDMQLLKLMEEKSLTSNYYKTAVNVWTERDVAKRQQAKDNNLNYFEIFSDDATYAIMQLNENFPNVFNKI